MNEILTSVKQEAMNAYKAEISSQIIMGQVKNSMIAAVKIGDNSITLIENLNCSPLIKCHCKTNLNQEDKCPLKKFIIDVVKEEFKKDDLFNNIDLTFVVEEKDFPVSPFKHYQFEVSVTFEFGNE